MWGGRRTVAACKEEAEREFWGGGDRGLGLGEWGGVVGIRRLGGGVCGGSGGIRGWVWVSGGRVVGIRGLGGWWGNMGLGVGE